MSLSVASGIPTFRGTNGFWNGFKSGEKKEKQNLDVIAEEDEDEMSSEEEEEKTKSRIEISPEEVLTCKFLIVHGLT